MSIVVWVVGARFGLLSSNIGAWIGHFDISILN
jgi:hypothetical protein